MGDFNRRMMLSAAASVAAGGTALAQSATPRQKGPLVWLEMDQQELDDAYDQSKYAANIDQLRKRYASNSETVRRRLGAPVRLAYGTTPIEGLDLYPVKKTNAPVHVFIHGGAWRAGSAKDNAFQAETFVRAGAHFITVDFNNVTETGGDLMPMADQVRRALAWVYKNAASFGGDPNRIFLSGHSSGGHLAGVVLTTDWERDFGLQKNIIKAAVCISGIYDLKPARLSARSNYVTFTDAVEQALSSQRHLANLNCPLVVAYGTYETPEFQRQGREFADAVKKIGKPVELLVGENYNHFEMAELLANPLSFLAQAALEQMDLKPV